MPLPEKKGSGPFFEKRVLTPFSLAAGLGLGLVLAVVMAAAAIRLGWSLGSIRAVHRVAASLEVLVVLWLGWMAWRSRAVLIALGLTVFLSALGIAFGQDPPPAAATANLLGGLALTATFAWILGKSGEKGSGPFFRSFAQEKRVLTPFSIFIAGLLALQLFLGARLAIVDLYAAALPFHGLLAVGLTALLVWVARARPFLLILAIATPLAGFTALHYEYSAAAALVHAAAAALLVASAAYGLGRVA